MFYPKNLVTIKNSCLLLQMPLHPQISHSIFKNPLSEHKNDLFPTKNSIQSMKMFLLPSKMQKNASTHKKAHLNTKLPVDIHKCLSILKYVNIQKCLVYTPLSEEEIWINILTQKVQCLLMDVIYGMI